ncbi:hypothetical protein [Curtobacterium sp. BRD11]|uniref:hypothetical protein n=1 Tax=Curtobacterium sp. BRD11 TaxID=2962581 RepID=UPI0028820D3B|nr:hypothetical protein [Curtobacterium sp. BRD11]MDT0211246.1 hypothetical protein [Curtobacterium sp. BRD11]
MIPEDVFEIGGIRFTGGAGSHGFTLEEGGIVGWDDSPSVRFDAVEREHGDGDFDLNEVLYNARLLTLSGLCHARSSEELGVFRNRLTGLPSKGLKVTGTTFGTTTFADGSTIAAASKFEVVVPGRLARYQLSRRFSNPRRYGRLNPVAAAGGDTAKVMHYGNAPASPVIVTSGDDGNGYVLNGPGGRTIEVTIPLVSGQPHSIDLATGQLSIAGVVRYGVFGSADMFTIPPGRTVDVSMTNTSSASRMTVNTFDTYI